MTEHLTVDPSDPRLGHGVDEVPVPQNDLYLVLSDEERAKGFARPVRQTYRHVGVRPSHPLRDLTDEEKVRWGWADYVAFEPYPESESPATGRFWTQGQLDARGCGAETTMGVTIAETYARNPTFYGATYCVHCAMHRPVAEFVWEDGSTVGS